MTMTIGRKTHDGSSKKSSIGLIPSIFLFTAVSLILTELAGVISTIIDGLITSRFLGGDAYSAISLLGPFVSFLLLIASFFSTGCQVVSSGHLGRGEKEDARSVFSTTILFMIVISAILVAICVFKPDILISISGVSMNRKPELYPLMNRYLRGYLIGIPALMLIQLISPVITMDGSLRLLPISSIVLCVVNITGDLISALVLKAGVFGIGLSSAIALYVQLAVLISHFIRRKNVFRLSLRYSRPSRLRDIARAGSPSLVRKMASVLRDLIINRFNLAVALSTAAIAARGMQNDLNLLMFCLATGVSRTMLTMSSVYYSAEDRTGLKRLFSFAMKFGIIASAGAGALLAFAAPSIARYYTDDPELIAMAVFSIRCLAVSLAFDTASVSFQNYLQGIQRRKIVNVISLCERFAIPVVLALVLGFLFGSKGILASVAVGKILLVLVMLLVICVKSRGIPKHWEDFMFLPEGFGGSRQDNMYERIDTIDDVVPVSEKAQAFCLDHGIDKKTAERIALFTEEMAGNVILHGKKKRFGTYGVDYRLAVNDDKISITFRDFCKAFDPIMWQELHSKDAASETVGIRMVLGLAEDVRYFNAFRSNNLILYLDRKQADAS